LAWYEIDTNWYVIRAMKAVGLAKDIRVAQLPEAEKNNVVAEAADTVAPDVQQDMVSA
jgi:hypothetical protein